MTFLFYMFIEVIVLLLFHYAVKTYSGKKLSLGMVCYLVSFSILLFVIIFRNIDVGKDYERYYKAILRIHTGKEYPMDIQWLSVGFRVLIRIVGGFHLPDNMVPFVVIWIISAITLYCFFRVCVTFSKGSTMSLFLFLSFCLYFQIMNQFRQMMAIAIVLLAYQYIDQSILKYMLMVLLAASFHSSAFVMAPFYFIVKLHINVKLIFGYLLACVAAIFLYSKIVVLLKRSTYGAIYFGWSDFDFAFGGSAVINLMIRVLLLVLCLNVRKNIIKKDSKYEILYHMIIVCTIVQVFAVISYVFGRITTYFFVYYLILIPEVAKEYRNKIAQNSKTLYDILVYVMLFLYQCVYYFGQGADAAGYGNYTTIFHNSMYWK